MRYAHPILWRKNDASYRSGIMLTNGDPANPDDFWELQQGSTLGKLKTWDSIEGFLGDLRKSNEYRASLGIPEMSYPAFSFDAYGQGKIPSIIALIERGRQSGYEVRCWVSEESAMLVVCFSTFDLSEDSGWDIYEWANIHGNAHSDSFGYSSWYEYCFFGIPIYDTWKLENRSERLVAIAPDDSKFAFFG